MIKAKELYKNYPGTYKERNILKKVNLDIRKGEFCIVAGRSGAGKSTLLHILAGLDIPDRGECWIGNEHVSIMNEEDRAAMRLKNIGFVFQTFNFLSSLKIEDNIIIPGILLEEESLDSLKHRAMSLSELLGIDKVLNQLPSEVSGGELQRACIARAMINHPRVILADEPTGNLDTTNREIVIDSFNMIKDEFSVTIMVVTHDEEIEKSCDRVFHLQDGTLNEA